MTSDKRGGRCPPLPPQTDRKIKTQIPLTKTTRRIKTSESRRFQPPFTGPEFRDIYYRNLKLIDWRLAPPLDQHFRLEFKQPDIEAFKMLCAKWGLNEVFDSWQGFSVPRAPGQIAVNQIRKILEAASSI